MRWAFSNGLLSVGNVTVIGVSLVGYLFGEHLQYYFTPLQGSGYTGPCKVVTVGVPPLFFLLTAIGSILALAGAFKSSKERFTRSFMELGNLLVLLHSVIGLFGYCGILRIFPWLYGGLAWNQPLVYTQLFSITMFGLAAYG